jgi:general secretion pathway protein F
MQFNVRTYHASSGAIAERAMEGENVLEIQQILAQEGVTVLSVVARRGQLIPARKAGFDIVLFCEELRTLLSSGMSLVEAVETLCSKDSADHRRAVLVEIRQRLLEGKPLSAALALNRFSFPQLLIASIRASERTSRIEEALEEYIGYEKVGQDLRKKIVSAAVYPGLVIGFGALVSTFMLSYVVPRFSKVYEDFSDSISVSTMILMKVGQFTGQYFWVLMLGVLALFIALFVLYRNGKLKVLLLRLLSRFKFAKYYLRLYQLARVYQTMSMLLKGGYTLADAIPLAHNLAFDKLLQQQIMGARVAVMEGKRLSKAFSDNGLTDTVTERLLQVGERSGNLSNILDIISHTYRQEFTLFVERATRLAEPLLLMVVGVMIGAIIILMYMPVFDLAGGL